jgi:cytochrome c oxidase subunit 3
MIETDLSLSEKDFQKEKRKKVAKPLLWVGMISIVMLFAGLTSAVIVRKGDGNWLNFEIPESFLWSTIVIVISSATFLLASIAAKNDNTSQLKIFLSLTMFLGLTFVFLQFEGYNKLVEEQVFFTGAEHNASGSFLYIISGLHLAHLFGGIIALIIVLFNAFKEKYSSKNLLGLQLCSTYWHFMGGMWLYLYFFFRLII